MSGFLFSEIQRELESEAGDAVALRVASDSPEIKRLRAEIEVLNKKIAWYTAKRDSQKYTENETDTDDAAIRRHQESIRGYESAIAKIEKDLSDDKRGGLHILSFTDVQSLLTDNEAFVFIGHYHDSPVLTELGTQPSIMLREMNSDRIFEPFGFAPQLDSSEAFIVWVITKTKIEWKRIAASSAELKVEVSALRCGLDHTAWQGDGDAKCQELTGRSKPAGELPPFDVARAHRLYALIFDRVAGEIKNKKLIVVTPPPLNTIPFHVLVSEPAQSASVRSARWLTYDHAISVLPTVKSFLDLRTARRASKASKAFIGFGAPVLDGNASCGKVTIPEQCPSDPSTIAPAELVQRIASSSTGLTSYFRGGTADVAAIRKMCPLPDSEYELRCIAKTLEGAGSADVILGASMTEAEVKRSALQGYRIVHFATHALLTPQPALVLTPPASATDVDDGLLTAPEIAKLKLDADWVVLSACNTAGAKDSKSTTLSGLATAFFMSGAGSLLVSHWEVQSQAAAFLTSSTFAELGRSPDLSRSEAFRRSMLYLMKSNPRAGHPSIWAPFELVGQD